VTAIKSFLLFISRVFAVMDTSDGSVAQRLLTARGAAERAAARHANSIEGSWTGSENFIILCKADRFKGPSGKTAKDFALGGPR